MQVAIKPGAQIFIIATVRVDDFVGILFGRSDQLVGDFLAACVTVAGGDCDCFAVVLDDVGAVVPAVGSGSDQFGGAQRTKGADQEGRGDERGEFKRLCN